MQSFFCNEWYQFKRFCGGERPHCVSKRAGRVAEDKGQKLLVIGNGLQASDTRTCCELPDCIEHD